MPAALKLDRSQIHLKITYGSDNRKRNRIKGRWPGSGQPSSYTLAPGTLKMSSAKEILTAVFKAEEELFLRHIELTLKVGKSHKGKLNINGCFPGSPGVSISDDTTVIRLKRNKKMRQMIRFVRKGSTVRIIWDFNCYLPESTSIHLDPVQITRTSGGLQPGSVQRSLQNGVNTIWIAPSEEKRGIRVKDLEENLSWMERERLFFNLVQIEGIHSKAGDWDNLHTDYRGKIGFINRRIEHNGMIPALGFEPVYAEMDSEIARLHPDWLAGNRKGEALILPLSRQRKVYILDFTNPQVKEYLEESINIFKKQWGFKAFHLLGLNALLLPARHSDNSMESGRILYSALEFFRSVMGKDCFISARDVPFITEENFLDMIFSPSPPCRKNSAKEIAKALHRRFEIDSFSRYPWILNSGHYPLQDICSNRQAGESYRQMLLLNGGSLQLNQHLPDLDEPGKEELKQLINSFSKFSKGVTQLLECPRKNEASIVFNSSGYIGVFNLSSKKQKVLLNMGSLKQEIYNKTGESPIQEGRTGMNTGELELILPPYGSRIFKF
ncbi:MAG: alpha-galactosidase [Spirochaetales bacterium]|nr:alpha-galactosidase [Spirochaetales bacterium]